MKKHILLYILFIPAFVWGNEDSSLLHFRYSLSELKLMMSKEKQADFEKAVYLSEAPYWDNVYTYEQFVKIIDLHFSRVKLLVDKNNQENTIDFDVKVNSNGRFNIDDLYYTPEEKKKLYNDALKNWAIFKYVTDTTSFHSYIHYPYTYSATDPFGKEEWSTTQVINLINSSQQSGNCYSLTAFYKILANRLKTEARICTAPQHIYIQHKDQKGQWYNVELATAGFPSDGDLLTLTNSPAESIKSGIALRSYTDEELIGLSIINLAKSFERKYKTKSDDFLLECADFVLQHDPKNLNALLLKQQVLDEQIAEYCQKNSMSNIEQIKESQQIAAPFIELNKHLALLYSLYYRPMPVDMQEVVLNGFKNEEAYRLYMKDKNPSPFTSFEPLEKEDAEYVSLSGGLFKEVHEQNDFERFGHFEFDTKKMAISSFLNDDFEQNIIDPVAFAYNFGARIYDSRIGRFLSTDPLEAKYPHWSPYHAFAGNPIIFKDPDGRENVIYLTDLSLTKPGLSMEDKVSIMNRLQTIADEANNGYKSKGLTPRVVVVDNILSADQLDKSDVFATIGTKAQLQEFDDNYSNHAGSKGAGDFDLVGVQNMGPEESTSMGGYGGDAGDRIALDIDQINAGFKSQEFSSPEEYAAWLIQHGSGHNAAIAHSDGNNTSRNQQQSGEGPDLMTSGQKAQFLPNKGKATRNKVGPKLRSLFTRKKFTENPAKSNIR